MSAVSVDEWLEKARAIAHLVEQYRNDGERERRLTQPVFDALREAGFFRMRLPRRYGGYEVNLETLLRVGEEVAAQDAAVAWNLIVGVVHNLLFAYLPEAMAEEILTEDPDIVIAGGGNPAGARAESFEGGYLVSGTWALASGCQQASWFFGGSFIMDDGRPRLGPDGQPEPRIFLFPGRMAKSSTHGIPSACAEPAATTFEQMKSVSRGPAACTAVVSSGPTRTPVPRADPRWAWSVTGR
jgi:alkylation response protein AidB-like acyl-CoA dehydrogenase